MAAIAGTNIIDKIVPYDTNDTHATHEDKYGQGGHVSVANYTERNSITPERRKEGMTVYVISDQTKWQLKPGFSLSNPTLLNTDWIDVTYTDISIYVDNNAIKTKYRRGFNNTGSVILDYKVVGLNGGETTGYPHIKIYDDYKYPALGLTTTSILTGTQDKIINYGVVTLINGIIDTTSIPIGTKVYANTSGNLTLNWTSCVVGRTLDQSTTPKILIHFTDSIFEYLEFNFTSITNATFNHNFERYSNIIIMNTAREDISSGVLLTHSADKKSVTISTNNPISGYIIFT